MTTETASPTPGPWRVLAEANALDNLVIQGQRHPGNEGPKPIVAEAWGLMPDRREDKANALLIAAAPDLLAACEKFVTARNAGIYMPPYEMRAAIKKAKGQ